MVTARLGVALAMLVLVCRGADALTPSTAGTPTEASANGVMRLERMFAGVRVAAEIRGHSLPVDRSRGQDHPRDARCSGGRNPCTLVDSLTIRVNGQAIDMPRSIPVRVSDVDRASLSAGGSGVYKLTIECGDASVAYEAIILFDRKRVRQLDIVDSEANMLAERTIFRDLSHAFEN